MKKTTLLAAMAAIVLASCQKENENIPPRPVETSTKIIHFSLSQAKYYDDERYDGLQANTRISVAKVSKNDGATIVLWDTIIANQSIRLYPLPHQPFTFTKTFNGINDYNDNLSVSYWIGYKDRNNQVSGEGKNDFAPSGNSGFNFHVRL